MQGATGASVWGVPWRGAGAGRGPPVHGGALGGVGCEGPGTMASRQNIALRHAACAFSMSCGPDVSRPVTDSNGHSV